MNWSRFCPGIDMKFALHKLMDSFSGEVYRRDLRTPLLVVRTPPRYLLLQCCDFAVSGAQCDVTDDASQSLLGGILLHYAGNRCLRKIFKHGTYIALQCSEVNLRLCYQLANLLKVNVEFSRLSDRAIDAVERRIV